MNIAHNEHVTLQLLDEIAQMQPGIFDRNYDIKEYRRRMLDVTVPKIVVFSGEVFLTAYQADYSTKGISGSNMFVWTAGAPNQDLAQEMFGLFHRQVSLLPSFNTTSLKISQRCTDLYRFAKNIGYKDEVADAGQRILTRTLDRILHPLMIHAMS